MKNHRYRIVLLLLLCPIVMSAQSSEEVTVAEAVKLLFTGMYKGDSSMVRSAFTKEVTMATVYRNKEGNQEIRREYSINDFVKSIGKPHPEPYAEEIWNLKIQIDGDFAQAWCDYAFFIGNKFSHCGVDAFQLHKSTGGWKIFHLADTRRKDNCIIPEEIQKKHN